MNSLPTIIISGFSMTALGIARCLSGFGYNIISIGKKGPAYKIPFYFSNIPNKRIIIPPQKDITEVLLDISNIFDESPILLLSEDIHALEISENRDLIDKYYTFILPDKNIVDKLLDKRKFTELAIKNKINIPKTLIIKNKGELDNTIDELSFPFLLKPYMMHSCKICCKNELLKYTKSFSPLNWRSVIAQEWIPGDDASIYFCFVFFNREIEPIASLTAQKIRQWPPQDGTTSLCKTIENKHVLDETIRIFKMFGLSGFGSIEYKFNNKDGKYYIMEPTVGRYNQQIAISKEAGVNLPNIAVSYLRRKKIPEFKQRNNIWWIHEVNDYLSQRHTRQSNKNGYLKHLFKSDTNVLFSKKDPMPILVTVGSELIAATKQNAKIKELTGHNC
jgi:D-aspartate ligase